MKDGKSTSAGWLKLFSGDRILPFVALSVLAHVLIAALLFSSTLHEPDLKPQETRMKVHLAPIATPKAMRHPTVGERRESEVESPPESASDKKLPKASKEQLKPLNVKKSAASKKQYKRKSEAAKSGKKFPKVSTPVLSGVSSFGYPYYFNMLKSGLFEAWLYPSEAASDGKLLRAMVALVINRDGSINSVRLEKASSNEVFDRSIIRAVEVAAPFPPLPDGYKGKTLGTIFVTFESHE